MIEPEKPTTIAKTKSAPKLSDFPLIVPKLMPVTMEITLRITESMMKMAKFASISRPMRLNMASLFLSLLRHCLWVRGRRFLTFLERGAARTERGSGGLFFFLSCVLENSTVTWGLRPFASSADL